MGNNGLKRSFGVIPLRNHKDTWEILLIRHKNGGHWSFPKGGADKGETELDTAKRELLEETNLNIKSWIKSKDQDTIITAYIEYNYKKLGMNRQKRVDFYAGIVEGEVKVQASEILDHKWLSINEVEGMITYQEDKNMWLNLKDQIVLCISK